MIDTKPTNRGFLLGKFTDRYGNKCSIQKSSLAMEDCIWLGVDVPFQTEECHVCKTPQPGTSLGEHSGMPVSSIRHRPLSSQVEACPFLLPRVRKSYTKKPRFHLTVDGQPMMECGVHEGRPGICRAFPFGRLIAYNNSQTMNPSEGKTMYVDFREQCRSCYPDFDGEGAPEFTIREFLEQTGVLQIHKDTDRWLGILSKMQAIHSPAFRLLIGAMAYDFDTPAMKAMGLRPDARLSSGDVAAVVAARPSGFALLMDALDALVDVALRHAPPEVLRGGGAEEHQADAPARTE